MWVVGVETLILIAIGAYVFHLGVTLKAMKESTHSVQFVPADSHFQQMTEEVKKAIEKDIFEEV
jgi:hypothetical protein